VYGAATLNGIRLLGQPRRCKHYATVPQRYAICTLPVLFTSLETPGNQSVNAV
jgi:hypothetical protein